MRTNSITVICGALIALAIGTSSIWAAGQKAIPQTPLTEADQKLEARYADQFKKLRTELTARVPQNDQATSDTLNKFLASDALDAKLAEYVVLLEATPQGLAEFAQQGKEQAALVEKMLADADLMKQMLVADGAKGGKYGQAMQIYTEIQKASTKARTGVLQRLALAVSLEHAVPMEQANPQADADAPKTIDPVKRYLSYEKAYLGGELDPEFDRLDTWNLRFVVEATEPDWTLAWGRQMLRNYRPDHVYNPDHGWRYVALVGSDVNYGSGNVKYDKPELQSNQNILMNGGVCGRRAFIGRFNLRAFGIPATSRPSSGHGALAHWTPRGWVVNLGGGWGCGWTATVYKKDTDFLASTQARNDRDAYLKVKRAQWIGDLLGEKRIYGESEGNPDFWNGLSLRTQRAIIDGLKVETLDALGAELGEADGPTIAEKVLAAEVKTEDKKITCGASGIVSIPAAAYSKPSGNTGEVVAMKSFAGGMQVFLPRFGVAGLTILRGGAWRDDAKWTKSGARLLGGGYGAYNNWGFRAAMSCTDKDPKRDVTIDIGDGAKMEFIYIKPGTFIMGGESTTDSRWTCVEVPKHEVTITRGFYMGKYEVTQEQFEAIMGSNPSMASKAPNCPVDNVGEAEAFKFCDDLAVKTGRDVRLPTEAEWEYACRAGSTTLWFFGDDPSLLGDYAWFQDNDGGKSHPVGQKKPNPWGLYDICGNVCERVSDRYARDYYAKSPKEDPTGLGQGIKSQFEYTVTASKPGKYSLAAQVVTVNYNQRLNVAVNGDAAETVIEMPFTCGKWQECKPVTLTLKEGENVLRFWRDNPPQQGMAIKDFTLTPVN